MAKQKFYETAEFKKIQKEWVQKLKDSGFEDSEYFEDYKDELLIKPMIIEPAKSSRVLTGEEVVYNKRTLTTQKMKNGVVTKCEVKIKDPDYYQFCHRLIREMDFREQFDTLIEKQKTKPNSLTKGQQYLFIFELHTEGVTLVDISKRLSDVIGKQVSHQRVSWVIDKVKARFIEIERG